MWRSNGGDIRNFTDNTSHIDWSIVSRRSYGIHRIQSTYASVVRDEKQLR